MQMYAYAATAPGKIERITLPVPEPDDYEVLVKNEGCVFCNTTDRMIVDDLFATPAYPVIFGHENFGKVIKVGKKVKNFKLGDRVLCANAIVRKFDGHYHSSWGGFAQYGIAGDLQAYLADGNTLNDANKYRARYKLNCTIPADLPLKEAGLIYTLAETASALKQFGDITGKSVVIIGTGIVGYFFTYFAKTFGAGHVACLGRRRSRLEIAKKCGADSNFIDISEATAALNAIGGADIVIECSGNYKALEHGLPYLKPGGTLAVYAVPHRPYEFDLAKCPNDFCYRRIDPQISTALNEVCDLMKAGNFPTDLFMTHQWNFGQVPQAYQQVCSGEVIKGLVTIE